VEISPDQFPEEDLHSAGPLLAVVVGLALRRPGDKAS